VGSHIVTTASILAGTPSVCATPAVQSGGSNIVSDTSCALAGVGDVEGVDPLLGELAHNGGPTETHLPAANSPAVDLIPVGSADLCDGSVTTDQRGVARPGGPACDAGAVEGSGPAAPALALVVDTHADDHDADVGDGVCDIGDGTCSLRAALEETNHRPTPDTIQLQAGLLAIEPEHGPYPITDSVVIDGGGGGLDASNSGTSTIQIQAGEVVVRDLVLTGFSAPGEAAGLHQTGGNLTLDGTRFDANSAGAGRGGGAVLVDAGVLQVADAEFVGNTADENGGALLVEDGEVVVEQSRFENNRAHQGNGGAIALHGGTLEVSDSLFFSDEAGGRGGGIYQADGDLDVTNSTFSSESADGDGAALAQADVELAAPLASDPGAVLKYVTVTRSQGGTALAGEAIDLSTSIVDHPAGIPACADLLASGGFNVVSDGSCDLDGATDAESVFPRLGPLADNGGPTETHLPAADSAAVDRVPGGTAGLCDVTVPTDQRGVTRPAGSSCDSGAVEGTGPAFGPTFPDVPTAHAFYEQIEWMAHLGITTGFPDGGFKPANDLVRQGVAAWLYRISGSPDVSGTPQQFTDVDDSHPFYDAIQWMGLEGISTGFPDGSFGPGEDMTRQAMAAWMYRLAGSPDVSGAPRQFTDVDDGHPFYEAIQWMGLEGISTGFPDGSFGPGADLLRQAVAAWLQRFSLVL
jgi:hypothetical protein